MTTTNGPALLYTVLGLNRAGRILYATVFCLAVPALAAWFVLLPGLRFRAPDEEWC